MLGMPPAVSSNIPSLGNRTGGRAETELLEGLLPIPILSPLASAIKSRFPVIKLGGGVAAPRVLPLLWRASQPPSVRGPGEGDPEEDDIMSMLRSCRLSSRLCRVSIDRSCIERCRRGSGEGGPRTPCPERGVSSAPRASGDRAMGPRSQLRHLQASTGRPAMRTWSEPPDNLRPLSRAARSSSCFLSAFCARRREEASAIFLSCACSFSNSSSIWLRPALRARVSLTVSSWASSTPVRRRSISRVPVIILSSCSILVSSSSSAFASASGTPRSSAAGSAAAAGRAPPRASRSRRRSSTHPRISLFVSRPWASARAEEALASRCASCAMTSLCACLEASESILAPTSARRPRSSSVDAQRATSACTLATAAEVASTPCMIFSRASGSPAPPALDMAMAATAACAPPPPPPPALTASISASTSLRICATSSASLLARRDLRISPIDVSRRERTPSTLALDALLSPSSRTWRLRDSMVLSTSPLVRPSMSLMVDSSPERSSCRAKPLSSTGLMMSTLKGAEPPSLAAATPAPALLLLRSRSSLLRSRISFRTSVSSRRRCSVSALRMRVDPSPAACCCTALSFVRFSLRIASSSSLPSPRLTLTSLVSLPPPTRPTLRSVAPPPAVIVSRRDINSARSALVPRRSEASSLSRPSTSATRCPAALAASPARPMACSRGSTFSSTLRSIFAASARNSATSSRVRRACSTPSEVLATISKSFLMDHVTLPSRSSSGPPSRPREIDFSTSAAGRLPPGLCAAGAGASPARPALLAARGRPFTSPLTRCCRSAMAAAVGRWEMCPNSSSIRRSSSRTRDSDTVSLPTSPCRRATSAWDWTRPSWSCANTFCISSGLMPSNDTSGGGAGTMLSRISASIFSTAGRSTLAASTLRIWLLRPSTTALRPSRPLLRASARSITDICSSVLEDWSLRSEKRLSSFSCRPVRSSTRRWSAWIVSICSCSRASSSATFASRALGAAPAAMLRFHAMRSSMVSRMLAICCSISSSRAKLFSVRSLNSCSS
mmetsp:Transcript_22717/g.70549  ORF Transcript_22717/g.70549 Transcript_22717/m.70549 type:complete len:1015 (-) Transcript_22717:160-3204(-)